MHRVRREIEFESINSRKSDEPVHWRGKWIMVKNVMKNQYQEIRVDTYEEIIQITKEYNDVFDLPRESNNQKDVFLQPFYRGQSNSEWEIEPSLFHAKIPKQRGEDIKIPKGLSLFSAIAYKQHYYTGTRFIDFTINPDIAVYFACSENSNKDGAVFLYCYEPHKAEWYSAIVMSEVEEIISTDKISIQFLSEKIYPNYPDIKKYFKDMRELNMGIISFLDHGFMVMSDDESIQENVRMKRQQGCFYVCGVKFDHDLLANDRFFLTAGAQLFYPQSAVIPDDLKNGKWLWKLIIPKEKKSDILKQLADKGITRDYLFPDDD